jgi:hypothetical protein
MERILQVVELEVYNMIVWDFLVAGAIREQDEFVQNNQVDNQSDIVAIENAMSKTHTDDTSNPYRTKRRVNGLSDVSAYGSK